MSARRVVLRSAFRSPTESAWSHAARDRQAQRLRLPKIAQRKTFAEWQADGRPLRTPA